MNSLHHFPRTSFIGNRFVGTPSTSASAATGNGRAIVDPSSGSSLLHVFDATEQHVNDAVSAAKHAFDGGEWRINAAKRRDALLAIAESIEENRNLLAEAEALTGRPIKDAGLDVDACVETFKFFAGFTDKMHGRFFPPTPTYNSYTMREPIGVCGLITSFNYPLLLASWKLAPCLAAGNTAVLKPAHQTPLSSLLLAKLISSKHLLPEGVFNVVLGDAEVGKELVAHPDVSKVSFTGSTTAVTGSSVATLLAQPYPRRGTFELGGKNAIIVFDDADLDLAMHHVLDAAFSNSGQNCCAASRLILHESIHDTFVSLLTQRAREINLGDALDPNTTMGPLVHPTSRDRAVTAIHAAVRDGSRLVLDGSDRATSREGFFLGPTILCGVAPESSLAQTELFAPVLAILPPFRTREEAVAMANATRYGLAGGVFSRDVGTVRYVVSKLRVGLVWVNAYNDVPPHLPLGGLKGSGYGYECGFEAVHEYTTVKSVYSAY
ncbi:glycine betaine aldehyde dehydrogenase [Chytriomyces sp. MP71]|nr:glycine betaine aldehyde dehydrogenase [Chytriomyces sp. MP71]